MSFNHYTYVGHFDPVHVENIVVTKPIDQELVNRLLAEYPTGVAKFVALRDGYACCQWAPAGGLMDDVFEFAYRLAHAEGCLAVENGRQVMYPPEAARAQGEALERATGQAGLADYQERQARDEVAAFEKRRTESGAAESGR